MFNVFGWVYHVKQPYLHRCYSSFESIYSGITNVELLNFALALAVPLSTVWYVPSECFFLTTTGFLQYLWQSVNVWVPVTVGQLVRNFARRWTDDWSVHMSMFIESCSLFPVTIVSSLLFNTWCFIIQTIDLKVTYIIVSSVCDD